MKIQFKPYGIFLHILLLLFLVFQCRNVLASIDSIALKNVRIEGDCVSVQVKGIMLGELVKEIKKSTGVEFDITESLLKSEISVNFKELSLLEGIKKIMYHLNYAIIYDPDDEISRVIILDKGNNSTMMAYNSNSFKSPDGYQYSEPSSHNPQKLNEQQLMNGGKEQVPSGSKLFKSSSRPDTDKRILKENPDTNAINKSFIGINAPIQAKPVSELTSIEGPTGTDAFIQKPPVPKIALIKGPLGTDIFVQVPPASETIQSEGPPGTDLIVISPPPGE